MEEPHYFVNGEILPASKASLRINDLALLRGYGIFDFFRTSNGRPFLMPHYLGRFFNSAGLLNLPIPYSKDAIKGIIDDLLAKNSFSESGIRMVLTGGYTPDGYTPADPNFFILVEKISFPDPSYYSGGIKLILHEHLRECSEIKSINYLTPIRLKDRIAEQKGYDVLYHFDHKILEVSRSNFFIVRGDTLVTPGKNILKGITRKTLIGIATRELKVEERDISLAELKEAGEAFITGTTKRVLPVRAVNDLIFGNGTPGPVTKKLMKLFSQFEETFKS